MTAEMQLSLEQLHTLRHMLGINTPNDRIPVPYRNYAAVVPGDREFVKLQATGAVEIYHRTDDYEYYRCTDAGRQAAIESHRLIRRSVGQRRYSAYLHLRDSFPRLTFHEFLTDPEWVEEWRNRV